MKVAKDETLHNIAYKMKTEVLDAGSIIFKPNDISTCMILI